MRADEFPTPTYVYDLDEVDRSHALLRQAIPAPSTLFYSVKANPHPAVVRALAELGCWAEICSPGELTSALDAGVAPRHLLYTGPGKRDADVNEAVKAGVRWFSVDSPVGLAQIGRAGESAGVELDCLLRINDAKPTTRPGLTMSGVASQFGADGEWVRRDPAGFADRAGVRVAGLHIYMASNIDTEPALVAQFATAISTARQLVDALGLRPRLIDLGGGFGAPFARSGALPRFPGLAAELADRLDAAFPGWRSGEPTVAFESGRYLASTCGVLFTRVLDIKRSHGRPVVVLESGINHLGGMSGLRRLPPIVPTLDHIDATNDMGTLRDAIVAGPLCTPLDTWSPSADLADVQVGDLLRVPNVGAYGLSASLLAFLGHPPPREVIVHSGRTVDVSRLELVRRPEALPMHPEERK